MIVYLKHLLNNFVRTPLVPRVREFHYFLIGSASLDSDGSARKTTTYLCTRNSLLIRPLRSLDSCGFLLMWADFVSATPSASKAHNGGPLALGQRIPAWTMRTKAVICHQQCGFNTLHLTFQHELSSSKLRLIIGGSPF